MIYWREKWINFDYSKQMNLVFIVLRFFISNYFNSMPNNITLTIQNVNTYCCDIGIRWCANIFTRIASVCILYKEIWCSDFCFLCYHRNTATRRIITNHLVKNFQLNFKEICLVSNECNIKLKWKPIYNKTPNKQN